MEYEDNDDLELIMTGMGEVFGQSPYGSETVFNFYTPFYQPARFGVHGEDVVAPEFQIFTAPFAVGLLNGLLSIIDNGVSSCDEGFGHAPGRGLS